MSQFEGIQFWAHQFYEHFHLIQSVLERNGLLDEEQEELNHLKAQWQLVEEDPEGYEDLENLIGRTAETKSAIQEQLIAEELPCLPDLLAHMIEELNYFQSAILNQEWSFLKEMQWWAQEHSENLDFANCQLPLLIQEDSLVAKVIGHPEIVDRMIEENRELSAQFKELISETDTHTLYQQLILLKAKHLEGLTAQIYSVKDLPVSESTASMVYDMLKHESAEAEFAFQRLEELEGQEASNKNN